MAMNLYEITFFFSLSLSPTGRPAFSPPLPAVEVSIGGQAVFVCSVLSNPPATVSWAFGHPPQPLSTNQRIVVANTTLTINNVRSSDEGFYECIANNSYGRNSTSGRLTIAGMYSVLPTAGVEGGGNRGSLPCASSVRGPQTLQDSFN